MDSFFPSSALSQSRSDLLTPVGQAIDQATQETLLAPDWAVNLQVCDLINAGPTEIGQDAVRAFSRKLRSKNQKVLQLTLTLLEAAVKNSDPNDGRFHALVGTQEFLQNVAALADGKKGWDVKEQALSLLQQWGLAFQSKQDSLAFHGLYMEMRLKGAQFPPLQASSPIFTPPPTSSPVLTSGASAPSVAEEGATTMPAVSSSSNDDHDAAAAAAAAEEELAKLADDLTQVRERARACREVLPRSPGIEAGDEALAEAIGFLEACKPRLADVVEAGMAGAGLSEALLAMALEVHEEVMQTLDAEKAKAAGAPESSLKTDTEGKTDDLLDFDAPPPPYDEATTRPIASYPDAQAGGGGGAPAAGMSSAADLDDLFGVAPGARAADAAPAAPGDLLLDVQGLRLDDGTAPKRGEEK